jgi:CheY-like chemotaxis protein
MLSSANESRSDNQTTPDGNADVRTVRLTSSRLDEVQLDHSIQIARNFSRRTAHDFNNTIAVMQGFACILQNRLKDDVALRDMAGQIAASADEALKLTGWLSVFANNNPVGLAQIDLGEVVAEFLSRARGELPATVQLQVNLVGGLPALNCDEEQLEQVFRHLWLNALEALPQGGQVCWETSLAQVTDQESGVESPYLRLRVRDSGGGMAESVQRSMFDPFFTTKHGKERGLGLTLVYEAVHAYRGFIQVASGPTEGTSVDVYWPVQQQIPPEVNASPESDGAQKLRKLLVVDDEEIIHLLVGEILKGQALEVVGASSGEQALETYQEADGAVAVVILDMSLPGIDGLTTFHKLRELDPLVKVIVSSGDPHQQAVRDIMDAGAFGLLSKPFRPAHLLEVVQQALA